MSEKTVEPGSMELELNGHIYIVEKDKDGNVTDRHELDGELVLKSLLVILEDALKVYATPAE